MNIFGRQIKFRLFDNPYFESEVSSMSLHQRFLPKAVYNKQSQRQPQKIQHGSVGGNENIEYLANVTMVKNILTEEYGLECVRCTHFSDIKTIQTSLSINERLISDTNISLIFQSAT